MKDDGLRIKDKETEQKIIRHIGTNVLCAALSVQDDKELIQIFSDFFEKGSCDQNRWSRYKRNGYAFNM